MHLYRAVYQATDPSVLKPRCMTFTASSAEEAARIAEDWQLPTDRLLTVRALRPALIAPAPGANQLELSL